MKNRRKIPAQDPSMWNKTTMVPIQLLLPTHYLLARGMFHTSLKWQCWCVYQHWDYMHIALDYHHPWNRYSVPLPVTGKLHNRSKLLAAQILYFPCSIFGSSRLNIKCIYTGLLPMHSSHPDPFCLKLKNCKEEGRLSLSGLWLLGFYILLSRWQSLLISSVTFPVPSQLRRGTGNTLVHTKKKRKRAGR